KTSGRNRRCTARFSHAHVVSSNLRRDWAAFRKQTPKALLLVTAARSECPTDVDLGQRVDRSVAAPTSVAVSVIADGLASGVVDHEARSQADREAVFCHHLNAEVEVDRVVDALDGAAAHVVEPVPEAGPDIGRPSPRER